MPRPIHRRHALALAAGGGALAVVGGAGLVVSAAFDKADLARAVLTRLVGPFRMSPGDFRTFVNAFDGAAGLPGGLKGDLLTLGQIARRGGDVAALLPRPMAVRFQAFERALLTSFVTTTDLIRGRASPGDEIRYIGFNPACSSPFASFEAL